MRTILFTAVISFTIAAQKCKNQKTRIPECIQKKIDQIKGQPRWSPPAEVHEYEYRGKRVFYFTADCCDQFNTVYDEQCHYICAPSGGFTGRGDGSCEDFMKEAKEVELVWKDDRK